MARPKNYACAACSRISVQDAQEKDCWSGQRCHQRRSDYRRRSRRNAEKRLKYKLAKDHAQRQRGPVTVSVPIPVVPVVPVGVIVVWSPKAGGVHAIGFEVYREVELIASAPPVHCTGWSDAQLREYVSNALATLGGQFGFTAFATRKVLPAKDCPIAGCPLARNFKG